jgi:hypothetical protein
MIRRQPVRLEYTSSDLIYPFNQLTGLLHSRSYIPPEVTPLP